jgi:[acyl-carrier-protein] S-malonyltransferase
MKAYVFPGQGAQFSGMGKELYEQSELARSLFAKANDILGFDIQSIMFEGSDEALKQTNVTQPAIFLHSTILAACLGEHFAPAMVAGHSLGEFGGQARRRHAKGLRSRPEHNGCYSRSRRRCCGAHLCPN